MRSLILFANVLLLFHSSAAQAAFVRILPGAIDHVVSTREHVAILRGGSVLVLREDGASLARFGERNSTMSTSDGKRSNEHMLDLLDVAEIDRGTDFSDELLDNERTLAQRKALKPRGALPAGTMLPTGLAANETDIWIARHGGLLRISADGAVSRMWTREGFRAPLAVTENQLLILKETDLILFELSSGERQASRQTTSIRHLSVSADGARRAWATDESITWIDPAGTQTFTAHAVADLTYCGDSLVALVADAVVVVPAGGTPQIRAHQPGARRVFCPSNKAMPWLLAANELLASSDEGRRWQAVATPTPAQVVDVAMSSHRLWLATVDGLYASTDDTVPFPSRLPPMERKSLRSRAPSVLSWLPKISVRAGGSFSPNGQQWEALAFAAFPLDSHAVPIVAAAVTDERTAQAEAQPLHVEERPADLRDWNQDCLRTARRKAVELAMAEPERARSYISRAGYAGWLPELRLLVSRRYGRSESIDVNNSSTALSSPLGIDTVNDVRYEARATWDLSRLVFSPEELAAQTQALHMAELRRDIEATFNRLFFERRALERTVVGDGRRGLRAVEIEADLDALSAGVFGACLASKTGAKQESDERAWR